MSSPETTAWPGRRGGGPRQSPQPTVATWTVLDRDTPHRVITLNCEESDTRSLPPVSGLRLRVVSGLSHAFRFVGPHGEFDSVSGRELGHEAGEVELDGADADVEFLADLGVRLSSCDREEHFFFSFGEGLDGLDWPGREGVVRESGQEPSGDPGVDERVALYRGVDGLDQLVGCGALEEKAPGACLEGSVDVFVGVERGDHYDGDRIVDSWSGE